MKAPRTPVIVYFPPETLALVDAWKNKRQSTRRAAILELLGLGLGQGPARPQENHTAALHAAMSALKEGGLSGSEIGRIVGLSRQRVKQIMDNYPLNPQKEALHPSLE